MIKKLIKIREMILMLRIGDKGDAVRNLQNLLISKGYSCGSAGADGDFGQSTYNAVIKFQGDHGLSQDGIVGPATWEALISGSFVKDSNNSYKHFTFL
ncbi:MAG: peptidoglycan-binding protein [Clostridium sp.]|nr:peptidoglycan-binding protein [Clostridium sp.]